MEHRSGRCSSSGPEIQTLSGRICRYQYSDRMLRGGALKAALISSRSAGGVGPWKIAIRSSPGRSRRSRR